MPDVRRIVVIGDTHCGSTTGLLPPGCSTTEGIALGLNAHQQWIWARWLDFTEKFVPEHCGTEPFALVINGDLIDGIHHGTMQVVSPDISDQFKIAIEALTPIVEQAERTYIILGTESHTRNVEHAIATYFEAKPAPDGRPAWDRLDIDVNGCLVRFVHHISTTSRVHLRASRLSIHLANAQLEALRAKHPIPNVLCAGHCHVLDHYSDDVGMCITGPSWQTLTRYGYKVVSNAVPHVGGYILDWTDKRPGDLPEVVAKKYVPEHPGVVKL